MTDTTIDRWHELLASWDRQQENYLHDREARFEVMLDAVGVVVASENGFSALDLACGPGAVSQRLLARFPHADVVAIDADPVMLALGQRALGTFDGRLRWVDADLRDPAWPTAIGTTRFDEVLSTTALHGMQARHLLAVYRRVHDLLRPGGIFLNGDRMAFPPQHPTIRRIQRTSKSSAKH